LVASCALVAGWTLVTLIAGRTLVAYRTLVTRRAFVASRTLVTNWSLRSNRSFRSNNASGVFACRAGGAGRACSACGAGRAAAGFDAEHALLTFAGQDDDALLAFEAAKFRLHEANVALFGPTLLDAEVDGFQRSFLRRLGGGGREANHRQACGESERQPAKLWLCERTSGHSGESPLLFIEHVLRPAPAIWGPSGVDHGTEKLDDCSGSSVQHPANVNGFA
jgi:hypothetical protein